MKKMLTSLVVLAALSGQANAYSLSECKEHNRLIIESVGTPGHPGTGQPVPGGATPICMPGCCPHEEPVTQFDYSKYFDQSSPTLSPQALDTKEIQGKWCTNNTTYPTMVIFSPTHQYTEALERGGITGWPLLRIASTKIEGNKIYLTFHGEDGFLAEGMRSTMQLENGILSQKEFGAYFTRCPFSNGESIEAIENLQQYPYREMMEKCERENASVGVRAFCLSVIQKSAALHFRLQLKQYDTHY